ncbi:hypothetical protein G8770_15020 [Aestuariicella hydrocarbonica]|uniref:Cytochrome c domain-containing protein n=1 Tax=Pseudomaricurvus hydrocarbonicus TaxID=1470433 RepID=A0A9E5MI53_9GAMM|nr:hypothetical protein [Aestuariicella hydrocarbonica]NHO66861.1 hypothetical protein [Aestuariicella hydrocarbonica]
MHKIRITTLAGFCFLVAASVQGRADNLPSFSAHVVPILKRRCATCHITGQEPGMMSLVPNKAYQSLVGVKSVESELLRVKAASPDESYLLHKILGSQLSAGGNGERMPFMAPPLSAAQIDTIRSWIESGAPDN